MAENALQNGTGTETDNAHPTGVTAGPRARRGVRGHALPSGSRAINAEGLPQPIEAEKLVDLITGMKALCQPTLLARYPKPMGFSHQNSSPQGIR